MDLIEAFILGLIQGLTEFLPVSSSGHLEIGKVLLGIDVNKSLSFTVAVHGATVLSTVVVFRKDILQLIMGVFRFSWNSETKYVINIALSMIPVAILGVFFKEEVESFFTGNLLYVGIALLFTALLLGFTYYSKQKEKDISPFHAFIIGIAQAIAVIPGISRSGSTIATGLLLGNKKDEIAKFSFLMVLIPIIGANAKDLLSGDFSNNASIGAGALIVGFIAAFVSGLLACKLMLKVVKRGKLIYFAIYCFLVGIFAILFNSFS